MKHEEEPSWSSLDELIEKADKGDADAQFQLGKRFLTEKSTATGSQRAIQWFRRAASANHVQALVELGYSYLTGNGTTPDPAKGCEFLERAVEQGDPRALRLLGICYRDGLGKRVSLEKAEQLFQQALRAGDEAAAAELGRLFEAKNDYAEAIRWYREAAECGDSNAQYDLGRIYAENKHDIRKACFWLRLAASDSIYAQTLLAQLIEVQEQSKQYPDFSESFNLWRQAAQAGNDYAQFRLGLCHLEGLGTQSDQTEAFRWFERAADEGNIQAQTEIGRMLLHGIGTDVNREKGIAILKQVSELGDAHAAQILAHYLERENPEEARKLREPVLKKLPPGEQKGESKQELKKSGTVVVKTNLKSTQYRLYEFLPPGTVLDNKYLIESYLAKGGMAAIFRAHHIHMQKPVAIKIMLPEKANDDESVARFRREAKTAIQLDHPNIVRMYDYGMIEEKPYLVMEFLEGTSLSDELAKGGPMGLDRAKRIVVQVCDAMEKAHELGIIHRDLKPPNIFLVANHPETDFVKVVDFGIAKLGSKQSQTHQLTKAGQVFGSLPYMSPEQCMGKTLDGRSDIYSLGCVLYEVLSGNVPFWARTAYDTMLLHIQATVPSLGNVLPEGVGPRVDEHLQRALAKNPEDRFATMQEFKEALLQI